MSTAIFVIHSEGYVKSPLYPDVCLKIALNFSGFPTSLSLGDAPGRQNSDWAIKPDLNLLLDVRFFGYVRLYCQKLRHTQLSSSGIPTYDSPFRAQNSPSRHARRNTGPRQMLEKCPHLAFMKRACFYARGAVPYQCSHKTV